MVVGCFFMCLQENGVEDRVTIVHGDALQVDLASATALFLYLVPQVRAAHQRVVRLCICNEC